MIWHLGRHLFESTLFAAAALVLALCCRNQSAAVRHRIWLLAAGKFAFPIALITFAGTHLRAVLDVHHSVDLRTALPVFNLAPPSPVSAAASGSLLPPVLLAIWLGGAFIALLSWSRKLFLPVDCSGVTTSAERAVLNDLQARLRLPTTVRLASSPQPFGPQLHGLWRPLILIPEALSQTLTRPELEAVILHELVHAHRRDNLTRALVHVIACVFWFYPPIWLIERMVEAECESACDEAVLLDGTAPEVYLRSILKVCRTHLNLPVAGYSNVTGSNLTRRLDRIMSHTPRKSSFRLVLFVSSALLVPVALAPLAAGLLSAASVEAQTAKTPSGEGAAPVSCTFNSAEFLEGTTIQVAGQRPQMCVRNPNGQGLWVRASQEMRNRSRSIITVPNPDQPGHTCEPKPTSSTTLCFCQDGPYSRGAVTDSAHGLLSCVAGKWQPSKPRT